MSTDALDIDHLDFTQEYGGLTYTVFAALARDQRREIERRCEAIAKERSKAAARGLTVEEVLGIVVGAVVPMETAQVVAAINGAKGLRYSAAIPNPAVLKHLEALLAQGKLERMKGDEAYRRWQPNHARVPNFTHNAWVWFTPAMAAELDERQRTGPIEVEARKNRYMNTLAKLQAVTGEQFPVSMTDQPKERRSFVHLDLVHFERLVGHVAKEG